MMDTIKTCSTTGSMLRFSYTSIPIKHSFQENISQPIKSQAVVLHKSGKKLTKRIR